LNVEKRGKEYEPRGGTYGLLKTEEISTDPWETWGTELEGQNEKDVTTISTNDSQKS